MVLSVQSRLSNARALLFAGHTVYLAFGDRIYARQDNSELQHLGSVREAFPFSWLVRWRPSRHLLRLGIHHIVIAHDGSIVVTMRRKLLRLAPGSNEFDVVSTIQSGNKPANKGVCIDAQGRIYYGEYSLNPERNRPVCLYRSNDNGGTFRKVYEFSKGRVRHIHFIQWDPYERCLWMGTGDWDSECLLLRSFDAGVTWSQVGGGAQLWRAVGLAFTIDAIYWGTDAGLDAGQHPNYIVRMSRQDHSTELVQRVQGPCHGTARLADGTILVSTGVEGGQNEVDRRAHLWAARPDEGWQQVLSWRKDFWPHILQTGVVRFPSGQEFTNAVHFTTAGLRGGGECYHLARIKA